MPTITKEIADQVVAGKYKSDNPTLQLALMKIIGTKDEAHRLNGTKQEIKQTGEISAEVITIQVNEKKKD